MTGSFSQILPIVSERIREGTLEAFRGTATEAARRIIDRCPVKTGRAKYHNQLQANSAVFDVTANTDPDGGAAKTAAAGAGSQLNLGDSAVIGNPLPYVEGLEHGTSTQAPSGFYGITEVEVPSIFVREMMAAV